MSAPVDVGYGVAVFTPFLNANFDLDTANKVVITPRDMDADDEITVLKITKNLKKMARASGERIAFDQVGDPSFSEFMILSGDEADDKLKGLAFPDSVLTESGDDSLRDFFQRPGILYTQWENMFKYEFKPVKADGTLKLKKFWVTFPRAYLLPDVEDKRGKDVSKTKYRVEAVGGSTVAVGLGDVDMSGTIDLSAGGTDKKMNLEIDAELYEDLDFGQGVSTTTASIIGVINTATGLTNAEISSGDFLKLTGSIEGSPIRISDSSEGVGQAALLLMGIAEKIYQGEVPSVRTGNTDLVPDIPPGTVG